MRYLPQVLMKGRRNPDVEYLKSDINLHANAIILGLSRLFGQETH
jgi:hypothetical protein